MQKKELKKFIATEQLSIVDAMKKMDENGCGILFMTDNNGKLCGSLSDGDIRRWLIKTGELGSNITPIMNHNPRYLFMGHGKDIYKYMIKEKITAVPIVDDELKVLDIEVNFSSRAVDLGRKNGALKETPVIIMAGGKGTRLYPYTKILPKPLIPIGDVPILERIMDRFSQYGVDEFYLVVNYKKDMIKSYFYDQKPKYQITYIDEKEPLGTAGGIRLIERCFDLPVVVTNCDILIDVEYDKVIEYHKSSGNDMTVISSLKNTAIPYGVLHTSENGIITSMEEKPRISNFINTGMYIIDPEFLKWIPAGKSYHMTDLAEAMMKRKKQVGMYPVSENSFLDMGEFEELKKMEGRISGHVE